MRTNTFLAVFSLFGILLSISVCTAETNEFSDIGGLEQREAIEFLQHSGVVKGYKDGTFGPEKEISRAEFLKIVMETATLEKLECSKTELKNIFPDVQTSDWFAQVVCDAKKTGIIKGHSDGLFRPYNSIELSEAAKIVALSQELEIDLKDEREWYKKYIDALKKEKAIAEKKTQIPSLRISRAQMADMTWRIQTGNEIIEKHDLPVINSCSELSHQLKKNERRSGRIGFGNEIFAIQEMTLDTAAPRAMMAKSAVVESADTSTSDDYSTTNTQEAGVDEADIIKNDGSHIFYARGSDVRIVKAYPIENFTQESKISIPQMQISQLYLSGDTLILIGRKMAEYNGGIEPITYAKIAVNSIAYHPRENNIEMRVFNISDRKNPKEVRNVTLEGNLISSRKIGDILYLVSEKYLPYESVMEEKNLPSITDGEERSSVAPKCGTIAYFPNFKNAKLLTVSAIDTKNTEEKITLKNILGAGDTIYSSLENLYVVQQGQKQVLQMASFPPRWDWENTSEIYKFSLDGLNVEFVTKGTVDGQVLNQYSMSEYEGNFRIATTKNSWGRNSKRSNEVYILDKNLKELGKIENIAPEEHIKSVRFMGPKGYLVTFKAVDPLFVIDMDPKKPKVLGELKIPGWSDYLHPIDENYLIGFGKEVNPESENKDRLTWDMLMGMKLAIFDVSDVKNPKEIHKTIIGDRGTDSEILNNPKSLFYDENRKLIGFPVRIQTRTSYAKDCTTVDGKEICEANLSGDKFETTFVGAQVYNFSIEDGFSLLGETSHFPEYEDETRKNWWDRNYTVERIVRIGENFYSASKGVIKSFNNSFENTGEVSFLGDMSCREITNEYSCQKRSDCEVEYYAFHCPEGQFCTQVMKFKQCITK